MDESFFVGRERKKKQLSGTKLSVQHLVNTTFNYRSSLKGLYSFSYMCVKFQTKERNSERKMDVIHPFLLAYLVFR